MKFHSEKRNPDDLKNVFGEKGWPDREERLAGYLDKEKDDTQALFQTSADIEPKLGAFIVSKLSGGALTPSDILYQPNIRNIADISDIFDKNPTKDEIRDKINEIAGQVFETMTPGELIAIINNSKYKQHITASSRFGKMGRGKQARHNAYIVALEKLINAAEYVGSAENKKPDKKKRVARYHYFRTVAKIGEQAWTVELVCEEIKPPRPPTPSSEIKVPLGRWAVSQGNNNTRQLRAQVKNIKNISNLYDVIERQKLYQQAEQAAESAKVPVLFQMGGRGYNGASYMENGRHIVKLSQTANRSTFLHEMSHIWLREIEGVILSGNADKETQDIFKTVTEFVADADQEGTTPEQIRGSAFTRAQHEKFSAAFEKYLMEGKAPTPKLAKAFAAIREWLINIYRTLSNIKVEVTPEIKEVFDKILTANIWAAELVCEEMKTPSGRDASSASKVAWLGVFTGEMITQRRADCK